MPNTVLSTLQININSEILTCSSHIYNFLLHILSEEEKDIIVIRSFKYPWNFLGLIQVRQFLKMKYHYTMNLLDLAYITTSNY